MASPARAQVDDVTRDALASLSAGDIDLMAEGLEYREQWRHTSGLDARSFSLVKIAALVALDAPPASYQWQVQNAVAAGVSPKDILGVLFAIAPQVGGPKVMAAAPEIMLALGLPLPTDGPDVGADRLRTQAAPWPSSVRGDVGDAPECEGNGVAEDFDIIIVGSGAGGGTLAHTLAPTGKRILILERGAARTATTMNTNTSMTTETWYDAHGRPLRSPARYCVGGATKMYAAALSRLRPLDFGRVAHMDGLSPAWPFSYADFEPWYARAEWLYQVHGVHGEDPTEGAWSAEYQWPPVTHEPAIAQLAHELTRAGYQPFHTPTGVLFDQPNRPDSGCVRCAMGAGLPCLLHARADAEVIAVHPLLGLMNVTLLVNAEVTRLETDAGGRSVTGVVVNHAGNREVYRAAIVVLAAGAVNSARILLRSAADAHPEGLANGSGQVGRNLMCHNQVDVTAAVREPHHAAFLRTLAVNDFYMGGRDARWPLGSIQLLGDGECDGDGDGDWDTDGEGAGQSDGPRADRPDPAPRAAARAITFRLTTEDLPRPGNRVKVDAEGRVGIAHVPTGDGAARLLCRGMRAMLSGTKTIAQEIRDRPARPVANRPADYAGTCRFGKDPTTSVLDTDCKAHELDNLYVVDASFFPSIGAMSPALTVMANAIRVGEHLAARLGSWRLTPARVPTGSPATGWSPAACDRARSSSG